MISPRTGKLLAEKYAAIPSHVANIEPADLGYIFKHAQNPHAFFPFFGLFATEFSLGYCNNMNSKRSETDDSCVGTKRHPDSKKWKR